jgi:hypothetical protein
VQVTDCLLSVQELTCSRILALFVDVGMPGGLRGLEAAQVQTGEKAKEK